MTKAPPETPFRGEAYRQVLGAFENGFTNLFDDVLGDFIGSNGVEHRRTFPYFKAEEVNLLVSKNFSPVKERFSKIF